METSMGRICYTLMYNYGITELHSIFNSQEDISCHMSGTRRWCDEFKTFHM
jgi:hypothetical protein